MEIKQTEEQYPLSFGACAEIDTQSFADQKVRSIILMFENTIVTLTEAECEELMNVLKGKKCLTLCVRDKNDYYAHTLVHNSAPEEHKGFVTDVERSLKDWRK